MKLIGFWLLVLLAVLVPATAAVATSIIFPTASAHKAQVHDPAAQAKNVEKHAAVSGSHTRVAKAKVAGKKAGVVDDQAEHCYDATPCGHCASCGSCASIVAVADLGVAAHPLALSALPEPGGPPAEFLQSGQERPPRTS